MRGGYGGTRVGQAYAVTGLQVCQVMQDFVHVGVAFGRLVFEAAGQDSAELR